LTKCILPSYGLAIEANATEEDQHIQLKAMKFTKLELAHAPTGQNIRQRGGSELELRYEKQLENFF